jgi:hypothetical protein
MEDELVGCFCFARRAPLHRSRLRGRTGETMNDEPERMPHFTAFEAARRILNLSIVASAVTVKGGSPLSGVSVKAAMGD